MTLFTPHIGRRTYDLPRIGPGLNAHKMVAELAVEMAADVWEAFAQQNENYHMMRANGQITEKTARLVFLERTAPKFLEDARRVLTELLTQPDEKIPPAAKRAIHEALILDNSFRANRVNAESSVVARPLSSSLVH